MFKKTAVSVVCAAALLVSGCASHLSPGQKRELNAYKEKGLFEQEKSVPLAAALGVLPVAGYAYTGNGYAAAGSLVTWVFLGPLWMPIDVGLAAQSRNYYNTKEHVEREKRKALRDIDRQLEDKTISYEQHLREQRAIEDKYSPY